MHNKCEEPACDAYFFQTVDPQTQECHVDPPFQIVLVCILLLFAAAEVFLQEFHERLSGSISRVLPER